ncbi:putative lauroyl/myristoyl acyltransferase involved in LPS biosynthesis [Roseobacter sp. MED193]|uniref:LPS biosynthesis protein YihE n=1 Tax=Roseobacter sp. MED193 TaxID=314262 RepID=UPI000068B694|nr:LPS biosynthesis protein YihE [Roseobacter sp. MED193]EAQ47479.1 putative lauroyl/myristoyl acyltransferase involved in LPS biosynthesis [Roseobacter sp. MED193]
MAKNRSAQAQETGWTEAREAGSVWQLKFMRLLASRPPKLIYVPLLWLISLVFAIDQRRLSTQGSILFLSRILGRSPTLLERMRHARVFSHAFFDRVRLLGRGVAQFSVTVQGGELVQDLVSQGKGAVLLGAHYGSFEALRALDRELPGLSVRYMMFTKHAGKSTGVLEGLNPEVHEKIISLENGPLAMVQVSDALSKGEFVAILGDRLPDGQVRAKQDVSFLGDTIQVPLSPYLIAMAARVPIILSHARWEARDRYAAEFTQFYDGAHVPRPERDKAAAEMAQNYATALEGWCRGDPYNWFNFFDIWRH